MPFTFVHTGDWHLGKPYGRFPAERASVLRHARLTAIERIAAVARSGGARHVLVAGDSYDQAMLPDKVVREPVEAMRRQRDLTWHCIPGNHDPDVAGGVWQRLRRDGLPDNVRVYIEPRPVEIETGVFLLPSPLASRATDGDPTAWMDEAQTPPGALRIGLAHGSTQGFGSERTASIQIDPARVAAAGLAYLALGDWHGARQAGERAWYAGTPEPDGFLDNDPGCCLLVRIDAGARAQVDRVETALFRWRRHRLAAEQPGALERLREEIAALGPEAGRLVLEVEAEGAMSLAADQELAATLDAIEAGLFHLSRKLDRVRVVAEAGDLARLDDDVLRRAGEEMARLSDDPANADRAVASRALRRLHALVCDLEAQP
jgi:DNA repair exonuclease SbcCD nuclease subunit